LVEKPRVLDAGVFIEGHSFHGITSESVADETAVPPTVEVLSPKKEFVAKARAAARETGDLDVLSSADIDIIALALQFNGIVVTSDFAVQNTAEHLGLEWEGAGKGITEKIDWIWYCPACNRTAPKKGECVFCGTETKRRPKTKKTRR
jgi:UPF0271 protein